MTPHFPRTYNRFLQAEALLLKLQVFLSNATFLFGQRNTQEQISRPIRRAFTGFINRYLLQHPESDGIFPEYMQLFRFIPGSMIDPYHPVF